MYKLGKAKLILISLLIAVIAITIGIIPGCKTTTAETAAETTAAETKAPETTAAETTAAAKEKITVGHLNVYMSDTYCVGIADTIKRKASEYTDAEVEVIAVDTNLELDKELKYMEDFITKKVDVVMIFCVATTGSYAAVKAALDAGIPVQYTNNTVVDPDGNQLKPFSGSDHFQAGQLQAEALAEVLPQDAQIVQYLGLAGQEHYERRKNGFQETIAELRPDIKILDQQLGGKSREEAMAVMDAWITKYPKIDAVVSCDDDYAMGALQALKAAGRLEGTFIVGMDGIPEAVQAVKDGEFLMDVKQDNIAIAEASFDQAMRLVMGETPDEIGDFLVKYKLINKDNVEEFMQ